MTEFCQYQKQFNQFSNTQIDNTQIKNVQNFITTNTLPYVFKLIPHLLQAFKSANSDLSNQLNDIFNIILSTMSPNSVGKLFQILFEYANVKYHWKIRSTSLQLIGKIADTAPIQTSAYLPDIVPQITEHMHDVKKEVKQSATSAMEACCDVIGNSDIEHMTPHIVTAISNPAEVPEIMHKLAGVVFVQSVKSSALSMVVPLLLRGLNAKMNATRRQSAVIIENMSKLVDDPIDAIPFLPRLLPALRNATDCMGDPEARSVLERTLKQLEKLESQTIGLKSHKLDVNVLKTEVSSKIPVETESQLSDFISDYVAYLCESLTLINDFSDDSWNDVLTQFNIYFNNDISSSITNHLKQLCQYMIKPIDKQENDDSDELLCDCQFTLAYGTKILLHNTKMKLKKGHKYGLIGAVNSGKSTFLKSMANGSLEGFPDPSVVKTVFVQADILGELNHLNCIDYVMQDPQLQNMSVDDVLATLNELGFNENSPAKPTSPVYTFSGGYRIKMAMAQAMLKNPDILLLDEPVKHLDVLNIAWVKNYINSLHNVTCIMVSKNKGFLNECCTDIINIDDFKLYQHKGNLDCFIEKNPDYAQYYEIKENEMKFQFPPVGHVEGVKSKGKALMKMNDCTFTYPGNTEPTIFNISVHVSMGSKVAMYGPNGHGKSTMIKVLTGEVVPQIGDVWSHENARVAYIAQHAFHHIESHLNKTPKEYLQWRYSGMVDKEGIVKLSMVPTEQELITQKEPFEFVWQDEESNATKKAMKIISEVTGSRKQNKNKEYEYEVRFKDGSEGQVSKTILIKRGFEKKMKEIDLKIAQLTGLTIKALTATNIEKHFKDCCGLDPEFVSHHRISQLSDGDKNLVVFGTACWNNPHIIIADEPTNFLSGKSLVALANALKTFEGGVVVITHDEEFAKHVCTQTWSMVNGHLTIAGDESNWIANQDDKIKEISQSQLVTEITDRAGNVTNVKIKKKLSKRDEKAKLKEIKKKIKDDMDLDSDEEELATEHNLY